MANKDIRVAAKSARVRLWQIAEAAGMWDTAFSRMLRHELPDEEKQRIIGIINRLAEEGQHEAN